MPGNERPIIAWDSCVFFAWFKKEEDKPLADIELILNDIVRGKYTLIVSAICYAEVVDRVQGSKAGTEFRGFMSRTNIVPANVDVRVADLAGEIRAAVLNEMDEKKRKGGMGTPDALVAATAIIYRAQVLHSFDPVLLGLSESDILHGLKVCEPISLDGQRALAPRRI